MPVLCESREDEGSIKPQQLLFLSEPGGDLLPGPVHMLRQSVLHVGGEDVRQGLVVWQQLTRAVLLSLLGQLGQVQLKVDVIRGHEGFLREGSI